jgi:hypothetical protein
MVSIHSNLFITINIVGEVQRLHVERVTPTILIRSLTSSKMVITTTLLLLSVKNVTTTTHLILFVTIIRQMTSDSSLHLYKPYLSETLHTHTHTSIPNDRFNPDTCGVEGVA